MKLRIYGREYKLRNSMVAPAKAILQQILEKAKIESELKNIPEFYTSMVLMMYVVSSAVLKEMNVENIYAMTEEIRKENESSRNENKPS